MQNDLYIFMDWASAQKSPIDTPQKWAGLLNPSLNFDYPDFDCQVWFWRLKKLQANYYWCIRVDILLAYTTDKGSKKQSTKSSSWKVL